MDVSGDGLFCPEVGKQSEEKYGYVSYSREIVFHWHEGSDTCRSLLLGRLPAG